MKILHVCVWCVVRGDESASRIGTIMFLFKLQSLEKKTKQTLERLFLRVYVCVCVFLYTRKKKHYTKKRRKTLFIYLTYCLCQRLRLLRQRKFIFARQKYRTSAICQMLTYECLYSIAIHCEARKKKKKKNVSSLSVVCCDAYFSY